MNIMSFRLPDGAGLFRLSALKPSPAGAFPFGLGRDGVHEVAAAGPGDLTAALGFTLAGLAQARPASLIWVTERMRAHDQGPVREDVAAAFLRPRPIILHVGVRRTIDALWTVEEALRTDGVSLVLAELAEADFTATRRLTLASRKHGRPAVLLMDQRREGATAAEARWRVRALPSAPNPYDLQAPGRPRWEAVLERARSAPGDVGRVFALEYDDETLSLDLVSGLAAGPAAARPAASVPEREAG